MKKEPHWLMDDDLNPFDRRITIRYNGIAREIQLKDILYLEACRVYTLIYVHNRKDPYVVGVHLKKMEERLCKAGFYRLNKSHTASIPMIMMYIPGKRKGKVILRDKKELQVSYRNKTAFEKFLSNYPGTVIMHEEPHRRAG